MINYQKSVIITDYNKCVLITDCASTHDLMYFLVTYVLLNVDEIRSFFFIC